jgi:regulator of nucleoside diphosphate kinase
MQKPQSKLLLGQTDYEIILAYIRRGWGSFKGKDSDELEAELKKAKVVADEKLPPDVVRLNAGVTIRDDKEEKLMELTLVTPDKADIKEKKISVMSPIGTALIGFRKGEQVWWTVPSGKKVFTILEVNHHMTLKQTS